MTSFAQITANRRNARRSTGPRSAAGKARVSQNAHKHGLTSKNGSFFSRPTDPALSRLWSAKLARHQRFWHNLLAPKTPLEHLLVTRIATLHFHRERLDVLEVYTFNTHSVLRHPDGTVENIGTSGSFLRHTAAFGRIWRAQSRLTRQIDRALAHLNALRATPKNHPRLAAILLPPCQKQKVSKQTQFFRRPQPTPLHPKPPDRAGPPPHHPEIVKFPP